MDLFKEFYSLMETKERDMWKRLQDLAQKPEVHTCSLKPFDENDERVYLYMLNKQMVFLLLDRNQTDNLDELADEHDLGEKNECPLYFTSSTQRVSPVFFLWRVMEFYKRWQHAAEEGDVSIQGVVFTNSYILNADDMKDIWKSINIHVLHRLKQLPYRLPCNGLEPDFIRCFFNSYKQRKMPTPLDYYKTLAAMNTEESNEAETITWDNLIDNEDTDFVETTYVNGEVIRSKKLPVATLLPPVPNPKEMLAQLSGLDIIKSHIQKLTALASYYQKVSSVFPGKGLPPMNMHALFLGNVGVGKSSVAAIYSAILHELGLLSRGHTILCSRASFVGKYYGSEEQNVRKILKVAAGGTLVIDEAYTLCPSDERDPSHRVMGLMLEALADEKRRDLCVILCGYEKPMRQLINSNPGLASRFPNVFSFQDFSLDQLWEIGWNRMTKNNYVFTNDGWKAFMVRVERIYKYRSANFGNAREIANLCEKVVLQHAVRCMEEQVEDPMRLLEITASDVENISKDRESVQLEKKIGFR